MFDQNSLKWTYILLKVLKLFYVFVSMILFLCVLVIAFSKQPFDSTGYLTFLTAILVGLAYFHFAVYKGLLKQEPNAWNSAVVLACLSLPSIFLPLGVLALKELFNDSLKQKYLLKDQGLDHAILNYAQPSSQNKSTLFVAGFTVAVLAVFISYNRYSKTHYSVSNALSANELYAKGQDCNTKRDFACSKAVFTRLLEMNPSDTTAMANLGFAQTYLGEHEDAIKTFQTYFEKGGQGIDAMAYYAETLNKLGKKDEALQWYAKALAKYPHLIDVIESMVAILTEQGKFDEGLVLVNSFIEKNPDAEKYLKTRREFLQEKSREGRAQTI